MRQMLWNRRQSRMCVCTHTCPSGTSWTVDPSGCSAEWKHKSLLELGALKNSVWCAERVLPSERGSSLWTERWPDCTSIWPKPSSSATENWKQQHISQWKHKARCSVYVQPNKGSKSSQTCFSLFISASGPSKAGWTSPVLVLKRLLKHS